MAVVIADAGPLIALAKIKQLHLLPALFTSIIITQGVADECLASPFQDATLIEQAIQSGWLHGVQNPPKTQPLSRSLGLGEQTRIEYALQTQDKILLIMDDALARKHALRKQLPIIGTAAVLFAAQHKALIDDAETLIAELKQVGYRISAAVIAELKTAHRS